MLVDPLTGDRTLLGATRGERPNEYRDGASQRCPFCPGNEAETPPEIASARDAAGAWSARVFRNRYPAVEPPHGEHEVIVDSPAHDGDISAAAFDLWRDRYRAALARMPGAVPVLFKNHGAAAGATIVHPHAQLVVLREDAPRLAAVRAFGAAYAVRHGRCAWCDELRAAADQSLVLRETPEAVLYVRPASRFGDAVSIAPRACAPSLHAASDAAWSAAGELLRGAIRALGPAPAFNVLAHSDPHAGAGQMHWTLELVPRTTALAGFELASGAYIKSTDAQESADGWRRMIAVLDGPI